MKKLIIYLFSILLVSSVDMISAQEYKYFNLTFRGNSLVSFSPKHLKEGSFERKIVKNWTIGVPKMNIYYFDMFMPIYKEIFGADFKGDSRILARISCTFWFREDFKPYYYRINFPASLLDEFPQWEEKLYQLCERSMKVDIRPFIEIQGDKSKFELSNFEINIGNLNQFSEGRLRVDELDLRY